MTKNQQKEMADRIKSRRESLGFTQERFCESINLSASSYTKIENAFQRPALDTLIKIAQHLDMSLDYIVFGAEKDKPQNPAITDKVNAILNGVDGGKLLYAAEIFSKIAKVSAK